jgi:hypothetical protein
MGMGKEYLFFQVVEVLVVHVKATFDRPIGHPLLPLDEFEDLLQHRIKVHGLSFTFRECSRSRTVFLYAV